MSEGGRFSRNLGYLSSDEQRVLGRSTVAIAGVGGDGGLLAVELARLGFGELRLADPEVFEIENTNRQAVCTSKTLGLNKAQAVGLYVGYINPEMRVLTYPMGVTRHNLDEFLDGVSLLIDETEFTKPELAVMLARAARRCSIPNLTALNIGFGAMVTTFHPRGVTLESRLGLEDDQDIEDVAKTPVPLSRWVPYVPGYGDVRMIGQVAAGEKPAPSIAPGVAIAAGTAATQAVLAVLGGRNRRPHPVYAPKVVIVDVMSMRVKTLGFNRLSHYRHLALAAARTALNLNPRASY